MRHGYGTYPDWMGAVDLRRSVGRIGRQLRDLNQGVLVIEFESHMVSDAKALQKASVANGERPRFSRGKKDGHGEGVLIDRDNRAAQQSGLRGCGCSHKVRRHSTGNEKEDGAQHQRQHPIR